MPLSCSHPRELSGGAAPPPRPARPGRKGWEPRRPPLLSWNPSLTLNPALAFPARDHAGARPPLQSPRKSAQVVDVKAAAYLHAHLHIFACSLNVCVCRAFPSPVGGDFVFPRGARRASAPSPAPRNPRRWRILGGGRPRARGRGFPSSLTQICARAAFPIPVEGFLSVICLPETMKTANCRDGVAAPGAPPLPPPSSSEVCARRSKPGPELPGPFHCPGGVSGGQGALNLSPTAAFPVPAVSHPH